MARNKLIATLILWPLSRLYGLGVAVRNQLYNRGVLKQRVMPVPVVVIGNLAVGGTGKTPHVEYLIEALRGRHKAAVLSRGYKRRTKGFVLASNRTSPEDVGDESFQIFRKYGHDVRVAVDEKRTEGIEKLMQADPKLDVMLLDDAFQHRKVRPTVAVVLTEYHRPAFNDSLLPYGRLREPMSSLGRADIVVVTKCPANVKPMEFRLYRETLNLFPYQKLYFSRYMYGHLEPVFPEHTDFVPYLDRLTERDTILVIAGIANPRPFVRYLRRFKAKVRLACFPDHHTFSHSDMETIARRVESMNGEHKYIVTTEKDAVRLSHNPYYPISLQAITYFLPITVRFIDSATAAGEATFEEAVEKLIANATLPDAAGEQSAAPARNN